MCILFVFVDASPRKDGFRLILASNRDEFYKRPAKRAERCSGTQVIAGRDMEIGKENGSWLGASTKSSERGFKFRCGALLNLTGEQKPGATKGRGNIVVDYLESSLTTVEYATQLKRFDDEIHPYNFVGVEVGEGHSLVLHTSNSEGTNRAVFNGKQVLAFGNSAVDCPLKKVLAGRDLFQGIVDDCNDTMKKDELYQKLLILLKDSTRHLPDKELERRAPNWYKGLSSIFVNITDAGYGTRTHTIIMVDYNWNYHFYEDTLKEPINIENPTWEHTIINNSN